MNEATVPQPTENACRHLHREPIYGGLLSRCADCGFAVTAQSPEVAYAESYFVGDQGNGYDFESTFSTAQGEARFGDELDRIEAQGLRGSVLDVGCATGQFLKIAQRRGWSVAGVELAEFARHRAAERLGVPICGSLDELEAGRAWDVVTLHHVLEHIADPVGFLGQHVRPRVRRHLLVEVPNFSSLASRAHGARWRDLRPEQHVSHFTPQSLEQCVAAAGFRVLRVYTLWGPLWSLRSSVETARLLPYLLRRTHPETAPAEVGPPVEDDVSGWMPPRGWKQLATEASRLAFSPIVRALEGAQLAERLAVEAEPAAH
jgi:SAM-dependent methyltransferase